MFCFPFFDIGTEQNKTFPFHKVLHFGNVGRRRTPEAAWRQRCLQAASSLPPASCVCLHSQNTALFERGKFYFAPSRCRRMENKTFLKGGSSDSQKKVLISSPPFLYFGENDRVPPNKNFGIPKGAERGAAVPLSATRVERRKKHPPACNHTATHHAGEKNL